MPTVHARTLKRAAEIVGGEEALALLFDTGLGALRPPMQAGVIIKPLIPLVSRQFH